MWAGPRGAWQAIPSHPSAITSPEWLEDVAKAGGVEVDVCQMRGVGQEGLVDEAGELGGGATEARAALSQQVSDQLCGAQCRDDQESRQLGTGVATLESRRLKLR